ncbi:hypothetical protein QUA03_13820, partial [Microcoleus sp. S36b_A4]|uniref:hypothetical protein n=1 Tax=Microcoleus sp. S36b_A4 TaxID=3055420 RepID=UPI002FD024EC
SIVLIDEVNLKKQGKFCRNGSVTGESVSKRTSEIGEVGPPLRQSQVCCVDKLPLLMTGAPSWTVS